MSTETFFIRRHHSWKTAPLICSMPADGSWMMTSCGPARPVTTTQCVGWVTCSLMASPNPPRKGNIRNNLELFHPAPPAEWEADLNLVLNNAAT
jgi:hypothetical protein